MMAAMTRREMLKLGASAAAVLRAGTLLGGSKPDEQQSAAETDKPFAFGLTELGKVRGRASKSIAASPLSVGFEVLDRKGFDPARTYGHLAALGVKWARCQTGWCRCEPKAGQFDFAWLDGVVDSLLKIGVQPWFNLGYGNRLYAPGCKDPAAVGWAPVFDDEARQAWVRFTGKIAEHYADRVRHWEIWNEPNITGFWKPKKPAAADYVELVKRTAPEIRKRVPNAVIVGGALAGTAERYLQACLEAGLADHVDRVSYHPYRAVPESGYRRQVAKLRKLLAEHKKGLHLWQGENGCPSQGGKGSVGALSKLPWTQTRQAKWLCRRILGDLILGLELTSYFHLVDLVGYRGGTNYKGLLRGKVYTPKPAYFAYQRLCALFDAQTKRRAELKLSLEGHRIVHTWWGGFARSGRAVYAYWYPADLLKPFAPKTFDMTFSAPAGAAIKEPVLVDPLGGGVYRPASARRTGDRLALGKLPMLEYPLLVTDRAVALAEGSPA